MQDTGVNAFIYFEPVQRFENGRDVRGFIGLNDSTSKKILNKLKTMKLRVIGRL